MRNVDVIVVGGGPAGSSCAWRLARGGVDVLVLDKERFPRLKLCAGWITPEVARDLEMDATTYPHRFLTFERLHVHLKGLHLPMRCVQHSIRRYEFDAWLLERAGVPVERHTVRQIARVGERFVVDGRWCCRWLVGAGGTRCPVYRALFRGANTRARELQTVTYEHEFAYRWEDGDCHLWFFEHGLPGYSWYVPKQDGWLNVGVGGMAEKLKRRGEDIKTHWARLTRRLASSGMVRDAVYAPAGYSYYLRGDVEVARIGNAFITGDAAGLATRDLCEGIGPAVRSGLRAAECITDTRREYRLDDVTGRSIDVKLASRALEWAFTGAA